jgi:hypothetical protein
VVSLLNVILGVVFILDAPPSGAILMTLPKAGHGTDMQITGGGTMLVGIVGIDGSIIKKK